MAVSPISGNTPAHGRWLFIMIDKCFKEVHLLRRMRLRPDRCNNSSSFTTTEIPQSRLECSGLGWESLTVWHAVVCSNRQLLNLQCCKGDFLPLHISCLFRRRFLQGRMWSTFPCSSSNYYPQELITAEQAFYGAYRVFLQRKTLQILVGKLIPTFQYLIRLKVMLIKIQSKSYFS